jgi:hypothetical protein
MKLSRATILHAGFLIAFAFLPACSFAQTDIVKSEGVTSPLHQANVGRVIFTTKSVPVENLKATDFVSEVELK